jgi:hypothetical protein
MKILGRTLLTLLATLTAQAQPVLAQTRTVTFPPAEAQPPPAVKAPPRTQAGGEDTGIIPDAGPSQRKTQDRTPPPPTNLTVMYKVEYGTKLEYVHPDGTKQVFEQWKSFPADASNLVSYVNTRLADGNNYQYATKPLASKEFDPVDIPILYMAGDYDFILTDSEVQNLRRYLMEGGTIIFNAARGRDEFSKAVARELRKVFPSKPLMRLPADHPIYHCRYRLQQVLMQANGTQFQKPPELYSVDIGTRAAAILVPMGLGAALSAEKYHPQGRHLVGESAIRLGVNLIAYVLGSTEYGKFLAQEFTVYDGRTRSGDLVKFAPVKYGGSWDVNPTLQNSLLQGLHTHTGIGVDYAPKPVSFDDVNLGRYPLVFMTGHYDFSLTPAEADGLARYLRNGGMLVVSSAGGLKPFDTAFRRELKKAFPKSELLKLPPTHALFSAGWNVVDRVAFTPAALKDDPGLEYPEFHALFIDGRVAILYTPYDLMSGVNHELNAYAKGISADDALRITINIFGYALSH